MAVHSVPWLQQTSDCYKTEKVTFSVVGYYFSRLHFFSALVAANFAPTDFSHCFLDRVDSKIKIDLAVDDDNVALLLYTGPDSSLS